MKNFRLATVSVLLLQGVASSWAASGKGLGPQSSQKAPHTSPLDVMAEARGGWAAELGSKSGSKTKECHYFGEDLIKKARKMKATCKVVADNPDGRQYACKGKAGFELLIFPNHRTCMGDLGKPQGPEPHPSFSP